MASAKYTKSTIREAHWITEQIAPGTPWVAGSFTHASTEAGLVRMGILVPTADPAVFVTAIAEIPNV